MMDGLREKVSFVLLTFVFVGVGYLVYHNRPSADVIAPPTSTLPDGAGRIYGATGGTAGGIVVFNRDGSFGANLTANTFDNEVGSYPDTLPDWTKSANPSLPLDGSRIVFASNRKSGPYRIFSIKADGSALTQLTTAEGATDASDEGPEIAPDGTKVAFVSNRVSKPQGLNFREVFLVNSDGSNLRQLSQTQQQGTEYGTVRSLTWSPDSTQIAVWGKRLAPVDGRQQFRPVVSVIDVASGSERVVSTFLDCGDEPAALDWSPDGGTILFGNATTCNGDRPVQLTFVNPATSMSTALPATAFGRIAVGPNQIRFSPDGTELLYARGVDGKVAVSALDGTNQREFAVGTDNGAVWWQPGKPLAAAKSLTVAPDDVIFWQQGQTAELTATLTRTDGETSHGVQKWKATDRIRMTNDRTGTIVAVNDGETQLTALNGGLTSNAVTVVVAQTPRISFGLTPGEPPTVTMTRYGDPSKELTVKYLVRIKSPKKRNWEYETKTASQVTFPAGSAKTTLPLSLAGVPATYFSATEERTVQIDINSNYDRVTALAGNAGKFSPAAWSYDFSMKGIPADVVSSAPASGSSPTTPAATTPSTTRPTPPTTSARTSSTPATTTTPGVSTTTTRAATPTPTTSTPATTSAPNTSVSSTPSSSVAPSSTQSSASSSTPSSAATNNQSTAQATTSPAEPPSHPAIDRMRDATTAAEVNALLGEAINEAQSRFDAATADARKVKDAAIAAAGANKRTVGKATNVFKNATKGAERAKKADIAAAKKLQKSKLAAFKKASRKR